MIDIFKELGEIFCKDFTPKKINELYKMLTERYSIIQFSESNELQVLFQFLAREMKIQEGNLVVIPSAYMQRLIKKYLNYSFPIEKCKL